MKKATQKAIDAALAKYTADIIKQLTEAAPKAHIAGDLAALNKLKSIAVDFKLVQAEALSYSKKYSKLLATKGGSVIDGKFTPWLKDSTAQKRQNIAKIITDGLKAGKPTSAIGGIKLGKGTIAYDLAKECSGKGDAWAVMVSRTETARIQSHGAMDRYKEQEIEEVKYLCGPNPCPICAADCQRVFKIGEAPELPRHPRCVCDYAPVVSREKRDIQQMNDKE